MIQILRNGLQFHFHNTLTYITLAQTSRYYTLLFLGIGSLSAEHVAKILYHP